MADIRINALATTAASTASDDFVAVDGSANGTRKLNAYSPTFGGNLTVSGTGTSSFQSTTPSTVQIANTTSGLADTQTAANNVVLGTLKFGHPSDSQSDKFPSIVGRFDSTDASFARATQLEFYTSSSSGNALGMTLNKDGNLTVSGTGTSSFAGRLSISSTTGVGLQTALAVSSSSGLGVFTDYTKTSGTSRTWSLGATGSSSSAGDNAFALYDGTAAAFRFLVTSGGNYLIGTTIDGGQKLQVSGTAYVSGDATFAGNITRTRSAAGSTGSAVTDYLVRLGNSTSPSAAGVLASNIGASNFRTSLVLRTTDTSGNAVDAATFDYAGDATFAGNVAIQSGKALRLYNPANSAFASIEMDSNNVVNVNYTTAFGVTIRTQGGTASTPASASAAGVAGTIQWDANYIYVCTAANTWKRVAIATWP